MSLFYTWQQSREEYGAFDLMIDDYEKGEYVTVPRLKEDPIAVLEKLGFVERLSKNKVFLHPAAFERVNYEHKNRLGYEKMTRTKTVTFTDGKWVFIPTRAMSYVYELKYSVVDTDFVGEPEELSRTEHGSIAIGISMPLATAWRLSDESSREKVLFEYAKQHIKDQVFNNTLSEREELQLSGSTAPQKCPFDPKRIEISFDKPFEFPVAGELETAKSTKTTVQIFLCYVREDKERLENLYQKLSDAGFKPWMAKKDLVGGERWKSRISQAIRRSDLFLACLSANSVDKRGFVQREIKDALDIWREKLESDIYLIPVRLEDCEVPESLRDFQ